MLLEEKFQIITFKHVLDMGITLTGTNAEVALGQWEYQCLGKGIKAADDLMGK